MIKKKFIYTLLVFPVLLNGQSDSLAFNDLIGKWDLNKIFLNSELIFDASNDSVAIEYNFYRARQSNKHYNEKDSLITVEEVKKNILKMKANSFIELKIDSTYKLMEIIGKPTNNYTVQEGKFHFDEKSQYLKLKKEAFYLFKRSESIVDFVGSPNIILQFKLEEK